jgi:hypothetical protein
MINSITEHWNKIVNFKGKTKYCLQMYVSINMNTSNFTSPSSKEIN